jgi:hypothetical protein
VAVVQYSTVHIYTQTVHSSSTVQCTFTHKQYTAAVQYSAHLHTNSTQNKEDGAHKTIKKKKNWELNWKVLAVPGLCELYPGICLTTEEKAWKNLS